LKLAKLRRLAMNTKDIASLQRIWLNLWHENTHREGGNAQLWLEAVLIFLRQRGDQVFPVELIKAEQKLIEQGLAQELFASLSNNVKPDLGMASDAEARAFELIHATPEERYAALREVKRV
jgi:hypothetical protein